MIRVLHVLEAVRGGTSRHVADIVRTTPHLEHHVAVPRRNQPDPSSGALVDTAAIESMRSDGAIIHRVDMRRSTTHPANALAVLRLTALMRRVRPAVVHGHSSVGGALARVAGAVGRLPVVYTPNALATGPVLVGIERTLGRVTTTFVAVSTSEAELASQLRLVRRDKIRIIPNGIDLEPPRPEAVVDLRAHLGLAPDVPLVGTVARLVPQKAPEDFVEVAKRVIADLPGVHAVLIGMGPLQGLVDERVKAAGIGAHFHQIEHLPDAGAALDQLDVFVLPSRFEGAPYTPLEAMRARVPVVLSDAVGNSDVVEPDVSGRICPVGDTTAMADAVIDLLNHPRQRQAMVDAASRRLVKEFDVDAMGQDLTDLYRSLAAERAHPEGISAPWRVRADAPHR